MSGGPAFPGLAGTWGVADIPAQSGRRALVTGGTSGLGLEVAAALAVAGADVTVAGRSAGRGAAALAEIRRRAPEARVAFRALDLGELAEVRAFAAATPADGPLDLLVANAGLRANRAAPVPGPVERHFAVNHLGHFLLAAELWPLLCAAPAGRLVTVASNAHWDGALGPDGLPAAAARPRQAYADAKLANLVFALELARRLAAAGLPTASVAAHPGTALTGLFAGDAPVRRGPGGWVAARVLAAVAQSAAEGALPILFAATSPRARNGDYVGPSSWAEWRGPPAPAVVSPAAADRRLGAALWAVSERLAGRDWRIGGAG